MKKRVVSLMLAAMMMVVAVGCGKGDKAGSAANGGGAAADASALGEDGKFAETHHITVEVYDRGNDGGSDPVNNKYTDYIKKGMLDKYNVEVEFVAVPRWTEVEQISNLLAANNAPDVCVTYDIATIETYGNMGGIVDMKDALETNKDILPNLWKHLGETNIYWDQHPDTKTIWDIEAVRENQNDVNTFIREDWLKKLGLEVPTTKEEFYNVLCAFRDNADKLLGADASKLIPYSISFDAGYRAKTLNYSFADPNMTDKEFYINSFDDRGFTIPGIKEGVKLLNKWYNEGLIWKDFALYGAGDKTEDDLIKAGYVGAFTHNWDYPFRDGENSIDANIKKFGGEDAKFIAIDPFEDKNGTHTKWISGPVDRKIFFPSTNDDILASLLYLDWISTPENIEYLQIGDEGVTHEVGEGGEISIIAATGNDIQNSGMNIDYTITTNGLKLVDPALTEKSLAYSYAGIDPQLVADADKIAKTDNRAAKSYHIGAIDAETGMGDPLNQKRDQILDQSIVAPVADFDKIFDQGMQEYLAAGGQAIIDERKAKWESIHGDKENLD
ncbi:putative aldouronate transport system substrate-binding protein [Butyrivibrio hungatei]|uniref:Putative aldouronate transport system substrate-binding protein n=1 Tax=Butyrivibrio hungatei TaxID=185008 RepID=A0A1G5E5G5_9FIRM|nr:extracellular solute-binding protein [Butyrivibrio hungatei]SCY22216.1 putative aldouronate transport system substrate-binding protein [Butyrivibrio hungatei]